jgi:hypothetical protein
MGAIIEILFKVCFPPQFRTQCNGSSACFSEIVEMYLHLLDKSGTPAKNANVCPWQESKLRPSDSSAVYFWISGPDVNNT